MRRLLRDVARNRTRFAVFYFAGSLAVSVVCFLAGDGRAVLAGLVNLWLIAITWRWVWSPYRRALSDWPAYYLEPNTVVITEDGVTISSAVTSGWFGWAAVTRVKERPYAFLLYVSGWSYRDLPRTGFTPEQDDELRRFLVGRGLLHGALTEVRPD
jgi:hypothetical protein